MNLDMLKIVHGVLHGKFSGYEAGIVEMTDDEFLMLGQAHERIVEIQDFLEANGPEAVLNEKAQMGLVISGWCVTILTEYVTMSIGAIEDPTCPEMIKRHARAKVDACREALGYFTELTKTYLN